MIADTPTTSERQKRAQALGSQIRAASAEHPVEVPLATSQRIIARVTDGIYREPWAAFRELCANAYDADASRVVIETGAPRFDQIVVRDDGLGMSADTLAYVVENIGGSSKRTQEGVQLHTASAEDSDKSPGLRPLIGKIGIGLFAVAQLTQHFQIITKVKGEQYRTWATILLQTHDETRLKEDPDQTFLAGVAKIVSEPVPESEKDSHGTTIVLHDLRPEIRNILQSVSRWQASEETGPAGDAMVPPPAYHIGRPVRGSDEGPNAPHLPWGDETDPLKRFEALFEAASDPEAEIKKSPSLEHLDEYLQSIWKLSLSLPLSYIGEHPFEAAGSDHLQFLDLPQNATKVAPLTLASAETIRGHLGLESGRPDPVGGFDILFDGVLLRRPIRLRTELVRPSRLKSPVLMAAKVTAPFSAEVLGRAGGVLRFEAYLYWNSRISPKDTQGVLLRVREASGTLFDRRFMNYQVSEQTRLAQITAEIFVQDGLDGAINIDRESYNYSHPHYIFIQKWLHRALRLFISRLKYVADEDLAAEKMHTAQVKRAATLETALNVWAERQGKEADPPAILAHPAQGGSATYKVDNWLDSIAEGDKPLAEALAVVLEAYNLLPELRSDRRASLVTDLIKVFRVQL